MIESNYFKIDGVWHCRRDADVLRQEIVVREVNGRNGSCVKVTGPVWVAAKLPKRLEVQHAVA